MKIMNKSGVKLLIFVVQEPPEIKNCFMAYIPCLYANIFQNLLQN